jgi:MFS superfamily sulfate permease-like transporter
MNDAAGGRTRVAGLFAAGSVAIVLLFLTGPLQYVPTAALGAVLIIASIGLLDLKSLKHFWVIDRSEFVFSLVATFGVIWVGAIQAVLFAVLLALLRFLQLSARPKTEVLGRIKGDAGFRSVGRHSDAVTTPGLVIFRFNGPVVFFNAAYFKREALAAADREGPGLRWFVIDMLPMTHLDITGLDTLLQLQDELARRGAKMVAAARRGEALEWLRARGLDTTLADAYHFPTLRAAYRAYRKQFGKDVGDNDGVPVHAGE